MRKSLLLLIALIIGVTASGCHYTTADRAQAERRYSDTPASIVCYDYGMPVFNGRTQGKPQRSDTGEGSWSFVDAANGRLTTIEGNCMIAYD